MVKRSENGVLVGVWLKEPRFFRWSEVIGLFSRVRWAAPDLQMQTDEPVVASDGLAKTATSTIRRNVTSRSVACVIET
tara:strand:- start:374 stop:607 length:234 start_codon:yes stop_codon:yes gene_type:complete